VNLKLKPAALFVYSTNLPVIDAVIWNLDDGFNSVAAAVAEAAPMVVSLAKLAGRTS
jgi:hypothetical protein